MLFTIFIFQITKKCFPRWNWLAVFSKPDFIVLIKPSKCIGRITRICARWWSKHHTVPKSVSKTSRLKHYKDHELVSRYSVDYLKEGRNRLSEEKYKYFMEYVYALQKETVFNFILLNPKGKDILNSFLENLKLADEEVFDYLIIKRKNLKS